MALGLTAAPILSTPDDHMQEVSAEACSRSRLSGDALYSTYEIARTVAEIRRGGWKRIALQFPDHMLVDAPRIAESLHRDLQETSSTDLFSTRRIHILADTSYSACCVDEIAAEHVDAEVVVHYGRTCLSRTSRLPVIYIYTLHPLDYEAVVRGFESTLSEKDAKVVVMADLTFHDHVNELVRRLHVLGYTNVVATEVVRNPEGVIPNRRIAGADDDDYDLFKSYSLFHVAEPPQSLLLVLHSRFASLNVLSVPEPLPSPSIDNSTARTASMLRRRFARVLSLASAGVIGILVNTLSVSNYLSSLSLLRDKVARAGKKSYTVVVGKLNPAKLANFAEVEGWVVVGCWESGLIEEDAGYWRPVVTPFELEVALMSEDQRTWGSEWWGGIEKLRPPCEASEGFMSFAKEDSTATEEQWPGEPDESSPPEFDLRTGRLVGHSRPMRFAIRSKGAPGAAPEADDKGVVQSSDGQMTKREAGEVASIKGVASPGAEFLRSKRTWQGLGSDFAEGDATTVIEDGRNGLARGYCLGDEQMEDETTRR